MSTLLSTKELARALGVKPSTVRDWARDGRLTPIRLSAKSLRFDLEAALMQLQTDAAAQTKGAVHE